MSCTEENDRNQRPDVQIAAFEAIIVLIVKYPVLRAIFETLGADTSLENIQVDKKYCSQKDREILIPRARKACPFLFFCAWFAFGFSWLGQLILFIILLLLWVHLVLRL